MFNTTPNNPFPPSSENAGGGTYALPVASADTLGGVKVGSRLSMDDGVLSADNQVYDFSTTEQKTGRKWLGKDTYVKVVEFGALPNNTSKRVESGLLNESVVRIWGTAKYNGDVAPLPSASTNNQYTITLKYDETTHEIIVYTLTDMSIYNADVVIEYTKTESEG